MSLLVKRWEVAPPIPFEAEKALRRYPPILRQILYTRNITDEAAACVYLEAHPPAGTSPFAMKGVAEAAERLAYAIDHDEKIAIYGDYDVDGVTATALLVDGLKCLGAQVRGYIPNRFDEGYGLNNEALTALKEEGTNLVVTVDCGIRSVDEADHARNIGLDLILTDHHHPHPDLPRAQVIINPKQPDDTYPEKDLAGVGLAYKLLEGLVIFLQERSGLEIPLDPAAYLDLVALGTVADLAPLTGENRYLVRAGLKRMRKIRRPGIAALLGVGGVTGERVNASDIGFVLGPRLNAAGRLDSALAAFELLSTTDVLEAGRLAQQLDNQNRERQQITREIQVRAEEIALADDPEALLLFAADPAFNSGVVGLAASRLSELYYRPAIVANQGDTFTRASCRSIPEFHITQALDECKDLLVRHGGHAMAAGFTVRNENLPELLHRLQQSAREQLAGLDLRPTLRADATVKLADLHPDLLPALDWLQPTGYSNPQAIFVSRNLNVVHSRAVGKDEAHLKLTVTDGWLTFDAIAFRMGEWVRQMPPQIDLMYTFETNEYNGRKSLQLNVRDLKASGTPD